MTKRNKVQCSRCSNTVSVAGAARALWNITVKQGRVIGHLCPGCQTPDENAEAEINAATTRYSRDAFGRMIGFPKFGADT